MKSIKVFWGEKRLKDVYVGATKWEVFKFRAIRFTKRFMVTSAAICSLGWAMYSGIVMGSRLFPSVAYAERVVEVPISVVPPVLERIAKCESGGSHYRNGQVVINATQDIGKYQINVPIWGKVATEMGYNLAEADDNEAMAMYIYQNYGTEPWYASKKCWSK